MYLVLKNWRRLLSRGRNERQLDSISTKTPIFTTAQTIEKTMRGHPGETVRLAQTMCQALGLRPKQEPHDGWEAEWSGRAEFELPTPRTPS